MTDHTNDTTDDHTTSCGCCGCCGRAEAERSDLTSRAGIEMCAAECAPGEGAGISGEGADLSGAANIGAPDDVENVEELKASVALDQDALYSVPPMKVVRCADGTIAGVLSARFDVDRGVVFDNDLVMLWPLDDDGPSVPDLAADVQRLTAERDRARDTAVLLEAEVARLSAGADFTEPEPGTVPTDAQFLGALLSMSAEDRLERISLLRSYAGLGATLAARGTHVGRVGQPEAGGE